ncbi:MULTISPECIES: DUF3489 domain-containing protein [unclassified Lysobacter]|uniref:DUF3489 domain-containing protein n=1 Tax=unclassified Lysobacter TaxID=2635362 RepID=UPI001BEA7649|nr:MULTISPECIES: DUF3489 domain-containing protein [unclassified Lysobacter]MBT2748293.1 DUF3489 domain-containing protein [Lysobacter sp. ISL-42]MBT2749940.1 DUF3489 domain-containing protein [Lysobacter sp. ISL-50]MBT2781268.1 DUF3489 domain-containing protein [Lysobacter sp. ISL-52]
MTDLTDSQHALILLAVESGGRIESFPDNLKGGARASVVRGLLLNDFIVANGSGHLLTEAGWRAVGYDGPPESVELEASAAESPSHAASSSNTKQPRLDLVVGLLTRPEGATISQVMAATHWQAHSVRGFFAGTVRKKGYPLTSTKEGKEERVYRIQTEAAPAGNATE